MAGRQASRAPPSLSQDRRQCRGGGGQSAGRRRRRNRLPAADERRMIRVQAEPFDPAAELAGFIEGGTGAGAIASFVGLVRSESDGENVSALELDHYPALTEKTIATIGDEARERFALAGL